MTDAREGERERGRGRERARIWGAGGFIAN
ncbi:unnamed protein product [Spirodela intermedia]|uniref:Uncharacterized protein n=1 Tax=Spirodela intermedia TaxID=51605 RepID=A0A7I8J9Y8_SPIIN|nr:unnamed protein product [Spirodela intermedia]CAA6666791.1 unnamed protein product [Spirodela intermedia]